jgi:hypothetical protein
MRQVSRLVRLPDGKISITPESQLHSLKKTSYRRESYDGSSYEEEAMIA